MSAHHVRSLSGVAFDSVTLRSKLMGDIRKRFLGLRYAAWHECCYDTVTMMADSDHGPCIVNAGVNCVSHIKSDYSVRRPTPASPECAHTYFQDGQDPPGTNTREEAE